MPQWNPHPTRPNPAYELVDQEFRAFVAAEPCIVRLYGNALARGVPNTLRTPGRAWSLGLAGSTSPALASMLVRAFNVDGAAHGRTARLDGNAIIFEGGRTPHRLELACSNPVRLVAHWRGYCPDGPDDPRPRTFGHFLEVANLLARISLAMSVAN